MFVLFYFIFPGVKNLLDIMRVYTLPEGVTRSQSRSTAYTFLSSADISVPTFKIFRNQFPQEFSILMTIKPKEMNNGYVLTVLDFSGNVRLGVQVGKDVVFVYGDYRDPQQFRFPTDITDGAWHQLSIKVQGEIMTFRLDCSYAATRPLKNHDTLSIPINSVISIGKPVIEKDGFPAFEVS